MADLFNANTINYYEILDVSPKATSQEVYQAYIRIKQTYSLKNPELFRNFSLDEIQQLLLFIEEAFATIGNPQSRELYDAYYFKSTLHVQEIIPSSDEFADDEIISAAPAVAPQKPQAQVANPAMPNPRAASFFTSDEPLTPPPAPIKPPEGFASTPTSLYEIDPTFEALIEGQQFFDGIFLSKVRKYKKVKLEDFSQQTCISIRYLYAIENNNYSALPAPVFVRGYINQYCKMLNLDSERVTASFMKLYNNGRE